MSDPLDTLAVLLLLPTLLPRSTSSPLPRPTDAVAALIHAIHTSLDFRLIRQPSIAGQTATTADTATASEDPETTKDVDVDDTASETTTAVDQDEASWTDPVEGQLADDWNARGEDSYTFEYRHEQSSMSFRIRVGRMGGRVQVDAMAGDGAPNTISIVLTDLLNPSAFPIPGSATSSGSTSNTAEAPAKTLGLQSVGSVSRFIQQYKRDVIAKILPGLQKDGYIEAGPSAGSGSDPRNPPPSQPSHNPPPARPDPLIDPMHPGRYAPGAVNPASIGHRDLDPFASMQPPGAFNPRGDGGGMFMGPDHPLLAGRRGREPGFEGGPGPEGFHPPGARWDPVGPGIPGGGGNGPRFPGVGGNPLGGVGSGDDGWGDEMPPPGEYGPDLGGMGGLGRGRGGGRGGMGGTFPGLGPGGFGGGRFGGGGGGGGGFGGGGGGGMFM